MLFRAILTFISVTLSGFTYAQNNSENYIYTNSYFDLSLINPVNYSFYNINTELTLYKNTGWPKPLFRVGAGAGNAFGKHLLFSIGLRTPGKPFNFTIEHGIAIREFENRKFLSGGFSYNFENGLLLRLMAHGYSDPEITIMAGIGYSIKWKEW